MPPSAPALSNPDRSARAFSPSRWACGLGVLFLLARSLSAGEVLPDAAAVSQATGIKEGFVIVVGSSDGRLEADLAAAGEGRILVQGLANARATVDAARERIAAAGQYGYATVAWTPDFKRLPYNDNLANLVIADLDATGAPTREEVLRITAPYSAAWVRTKGAWQKLAKPLPAEMGEWTHFNYGPEGNPQSRDSLVHVPRGLQWFVSSISTQTQATSRLAGGRLYHGGRLSSRSEQARLYVARDAFNGLPLWERPEVNSDRLRPDMERVTVADGKRIVGQIGEPGFSRAIDGATGKDLRIYDQGLKVAPAVKGEKYPQFLPQFLQALVGPHLIQGYEGEVVALDVESGARRWAWKAPEGRTVAWLAVGDGRVFVALTDDPGARHYSYNNQFNYLSEVTALQLADGAPQWTSTAMKDFPTFGIVYAEGGLFIQHAGIDRAMNRDPSTTRKSLTSAYGPLLRLDPATGREVFRTDVGAVEPKDRFWHNQLRVQDGAAYPGFGWVVRGFDAKTGTPRDRLYDVFGAQTHPIGFCSQVRGTARGQVGGKFVSFFDLQEKSLQFVAIARNTCDLAHYPGYGTIYTASDGCGCATYLRGLVALQCYQTTGGAVVPDGERLETGVRVTPAAADPEGAWPTLMGDPSRSGKAAVAVAANDQAKPTATASLALPKLIGPIGLDWARANLRLGHITPPVVAGDLMVVAVTDTHEVHGLHAATGAPRWRHRAGGRINSSPTLWRGLVLFGAGDGSVTALRATDGALAWRFLAAPERRSTVIDGQVESLWPVHGSVLVRQGKAFIAAGRHVTADGGVRLWRLDAATGAIEAQGRIDNRPTSEADPMPSLYEAQGRICDLLSMNSNDTLIGMGPIVIDPATLAWINYSLTKPTGTRAADPRVTRPAEDYLAGPATIGRDTAGVKNFLTAPSVGMIDRRTNNVGSKGQQGLRFGVFGSYETQYRGHQIVRDGTTIYAFDRALTRIEHTPDWKPVGELLERQDNKGKGTILVERMPAVIEGALLAGDRFYAADQKTIYLYGRDGKEQGTLSPAGKLVMHGLVAAHGRLYVAQDDGVIQIYGGR
jgi:outer membrane protein assembly factor BamB